MSGSAQNCVLVLVDFVPRQLGADKAIAHIWILLKTCFQGLLNMELLREERCTCLWTIGSSTACAR